MTAKLSIEMDDSVLDALLKVGSITVRLVPDSPGGAAGGMKTPREGSLPAQVLAWAAEDGAVFTTADVVEAFGLSRGHASMLLGKLANGAYPLRRVSRGRYQHPQAHAAVRLRRQSVWHEGEGDIDAFDETYYPALAALQRRELAGIAAGASRH